jgi:PKD repeat protein
LYDRFQCRQKVLDAFDNMTEEIPGEDIKNVLSLSPAIPYIQLYEEYKVYDKFKFYARSHILWVQAYDLLKASAALPELETIKYYNNFDSDANILDHSPRNKLRYQTRNLYKRSKGPFGLVTHRYGWKQNHGIACAAALLISAQVLNDAGVETDFFNKWYSYILIVGQISRLILEPMPHPNYSPINWHEFAKEGLYENLFVGEQWWPCDNNPTSPLKTEVNLYSSYSEGPHYTVYGLLDCGLPAMRAEQNFYFNGSQDPLLKKNEISNIFNWLNAISIGDNSIPTIDNTAPQMQGWELALTNNKEFNFGNGDKLFSNTADYVALMGGNNVSLSTSEKKSYDTELAEVGNIILRNKDERGAHYFQMLGEKENANAKKSGLFGLGGTHEDDDLGSFMIAAGDSPKSMVYLGVDPPYFSWSDAKATNKYWMHNTIEIDDGNPAEDRTYKNPKYTLIDEGKNTKIQKFNLEYDFVNEDHSMFSSAIKRNVIANNSTQNFYYFMSDYVDVDGIGEEDGVFQYIKLNLNGNGNKFINEAGGHTDSMTYRKVNGIHRWTYPCSTIYNNWSLSAHISVLGNAVSGTSYWEDYYTNDSYEADGTKANGIANGTTTRLRIHQPNTYKTIFQSFLYPQKCNEQLPIVTKTEEEHLVSTTIIFVNPVDTISYESKFGKMGNNTVPDSSSNFHFSKFSGNSDDSLLNPFNIGNKNLKIYFNSKEGYVNYHSIAYMGQGVKYCPPTYSNFRNISFNEGRYLIFKDTLVYSDKLISFNYWLNGRHNYTCTILPLEMPSSSDSIKIKLPDVSPGVEMVAIASSDDTIPGRYDSLTNYFYMLIPTGKKEFIIQEKQACKDCYFPPLGTDFDTIFLADDGKRHTIGNKKAINYPDGNMIISNSTRISMCEGVYLQNKDSLFIEGPPQRKGTQIPTCFGIDSIASASENSMLIVSSGSSLVLDAGSRTYVKTGGAIYVKQNGSLVIKDGAFVQIGDSTQSGWGEIIAEPGSYIYIEPDAHIEYRRMIGDTADRNLVVFASGASSANAGIYYWMDSTLKAENIIDPVIYPIGICSLDSLVPFYNKDWGYTNFGKPIANLNLGNDTLCPGEPLIIRMNRILNDAMAEIKVCRWDSIFNADGFLRMECVNDSTLLDSIPPDPICRMPRTLPDEWVYYFDINTRHQVSLKLINECGRIVDTSFLVVVRDTPHFTLTLPETACEGYQTVKAIAREWSGDSIFYTFEVTEELDTASLNFQIGNPGTIYSKTNYGLLPDTFDFPDYYFRGGRKYSISISITNLCGTSTQYGTVEIPTGVYIRLERSTLYANPVHGARSVQMHGFANNIDSFRWEPATWLNRSDTLLVTSTPEDSIAYTLLAFKDNCIAYDTAIIKVNHVANVGISDTICFNEGKILLGNGYDMTVFLGYLYYKGEVDFRNKFLIKTSDNEDYFRYFSMFMQTNSFKDWANSCSNLYTDFTENLMREQTIRKNWYISYFEGFTAFNDPSMNSLDSFIYYISNDYTLNGNYSTVNNWGNIGGCLDEMFSIYENFVSDQLNTVSISWIKISGLDTSYNGTIQESSIAIDSPEASTIYIQSVITDNYAEIDQTIIWVDTLPMAGFLVQFQFDSTVVFENFTQPKNAGNKYLWDFGDGTSNSFEENAIHEFMGFDTSFRVCLTVTNTCGTSTFCDTIYIDSAHWGGTFRISENKTYFEQESKPTNYAPDAIFYPNPMQNFGILSYRFKEEGETGNFYLRDSQGKLIIEKELKQQKDKLVIPTDSLAPGIYFYFIWSNQGNVFKGKLCK